MASSLISILSIALSFLSCLSCLAWMVPRGEAFMITPPPLGRTSMMTITKMTLFEEEERTEMQQRILSLSLEESDENRRERVANLFDSKLNGESEEDAAKFTLLFGETLNELGTQIQDMARSSAAAAAATSTTTETTSSGDENETPTERVKSKEEIQLWALIDMMVQSKTIVKKFKNDQES